MQVVENKVTVGGGEGSLASSKHAARPSRDLAQEARATVHRSGDTPLRSVD